MKAAKSFPSIILVLALSVVSLAPTAARAEAPANGIGAMIEEELTLLTQAEQAAIREAQEAAMAKARQEAAKQAAAETAAAASRTGTTGATARGLLGRAGIYAFLASGALEVMYYFTEDQVLFQDDLVSVNVPKVGGTEGMYVVNDRKSAKAIAFETRADAMEFVAEVERRGSFSAE